MKDIKKASLNLHKKNIGKLNIIPNNKVKNKDDLSIVYTPGVAYPCLEIADDKSKAFEYTIKGRIVAIVSDGSAVLGLGKIGPEASLPVMEGKSALLHEFAGIEAMPIVLDTYDPNKIIETVKNISPTFAAIMLEDISAPNCVYIENTLQKELDIPVFHDDQHGTAIVVTAALLNSLKIVNKAISEISVVLCGLGAAGSAVAKLFNKIGVKNIYAYDKTGVISKLNYDNYNFLTKDLLDNNIIKSPGKNIDKLEDLVKEKDVFVGVSTKDLLTENMIKSMNPNSIVFALANPSPEIMPDKAIKAGAKIVGTGRSDFPNQINNVLIFPGLMKGTLKARAKNVTDEMKINAAYAIANLVKDSELSENNILPSIFDKTVVDTVANAVYNAAKKRPL